MSGPDPSLADRARELPDRAGVYLFKDATKRIIYVGKAKSLNRRVRSYFNAGKDIKTRILLRNAADLEVIVTRDEYDALLLENTLIKQWKPRFNINLKDGKSYPVIRITSEPYPRVFRTRRIVFDGSSYFGPYAQAGRLDEYLALIEKLFPLRKCKGPLKARRHPCLYHHIGRCMAPCVGKADAAAYATTVERIKKLLAGRTEELLRDLEAAMAEASQRLDYERAALLRDQIRTIRDLTPQNQVVEVGRRSGASDRDYVGFAARGNRASFVVLQMRDGAMVGRETYRTEAYSAPEEAVAEFVLQYYGRLPETARPPRVAYLPEIARGDAAELSRYLAAERAGRPPIEARFPQRGRHARALGLAMENAAQDLTLYGRGEDADRAVEALQQALGLAKPPLRIEGFDISHLAGRQTVASMISFVDGRPDKSGYRHFSIRSLGDRVDDYAAMREAVARRYTRVLNDGLERPGLILVDGGRGQVSAAASVLASLGLEEIPLVGLAKENEEIWPAGAVEPLVLPRSSPALRVLQAVRDETHRFANSLRTRQKARQMARLTLESVRGIGPARSRLLLESYGSIEAIRQAPAEEIARLAHVSVETARALTERLAAPR